MLLRAEPPGQTPAVKTTRKGAEQRTGNAVGCAFSREGRADASQGMFLKRHGRNVRVSRGDLPDAFPPDEFGGHYELLGWKVRLLYSTQSEFSQMNSQLFRKLAYGCQPRMQNFANGVIETRDADVIRYPDSGLLQCLIYARSGLIGAHK